MESTTVVIAAERVVVAPHRMYLEMLFHRGRDVKRVRPFWFIPHPYTTEPETWEYL